MTEPVVWSAINISEGRDLKGLKALAEYLDSGGFGLADWSADPDHHRSVFTLVGTATALERGVEAIFAWVAQNLDLTSHSGVHPRLGAVDVVPFAPLSKATTIEDAQTIALRIASRIAERFVIPVFLYRESSTTPGALTLPDLRRGGPEALKERMIAGELVPNFGPRIPHPTLGVSVFGARPPLTAFNCMIDSYDLEIGRSIAREIRASSGGVPHLQALAFPLESRNGQIQVSMNILDPEATAPHIAYLAVEQACQKRGLGITSSELIGLVPLSALESAFKHFLQLEGFQPNQTAERNLLECVWEGKKNS